MSSKRNETEEKHFLRPTTKDNTKNTTIRQILKKIDTRYKTITTKKPTKMKRKLKQDVIELWVSKMNL